MRYFVVIFTLMFACLAFATAEEQTDWAGGPGVYGPVTNWQDRFFISDELDWDTEPGQLKLIVDRSEHQIAVANGPTFVIAVDMDMDGDLDAACCSYYGNEVFWAENMNGVGTNWTKHVIGTITNPQFITVADFDNNGYRDLVASSGSADEIVLFRYFTSGWSAGTTIASSFDARQIRNTDMDGDGLVDIIGVSSISGDVCWWKNNGTTTFWTINYIDGALIGAYACDIGDFNQDGHPDVVAASNSQNDVAAYISQAPYGYAWSKQTIETNYSNPVSIAVADINNDGRDDFALASSSGSGNLRWYDRVGGSWTTHQMTGASGLQIYDITAFDMDGDAHPDVVAASLGENKVIWFKNKEYLGQGWETFSVSTYFYGAVGVSVGDLDGDDVPDVLGCALYGDKVSWWRVSGFTSPAILTSSVLNIEPPDPNLAHWDYIHWSSTLPSGTSVMFRLRTSYSSGTMGTWSSWITAPADLSSLVTQGGSFLQYQARLATSNPNTTPSLKDVTILWTPVGIEDEGSAAIDGRRIWLTSGNPVSGAFSVGYNVEQPGMVNIAVYDAAGRTVSVIGDGELAAGEYSAIVSGLPAGTYAIVMQTEDGMAAQRVVVIP